MNFSTGLLIFGGIIAGLTICDRCAGCAEYVADAPHLNAPAK